MPVETTNLPCPRCGSPHPGLPLRPIRDPLLLRLEDGTQARPSAMFLCPTTHKVVYAITHPGAPAPSSA